MSLSVFVRSYHSALVPVALSHVSHYEAEQWEKNRHHTHIYKYMYARLNLVKSRVYLCFSFFFVCVSNPSTKPMLTSLQRWKEKGGEKKQRKRDNGCTAKSAFLSLPRCLKHAFCPIHTWLSMRIS